MASDDLIRRRLSTMRILAGALILGLGLATVIFSLLPAPEGRPDPTLALAMFWMACGLLLVNGILSFVLPNILTEMQVRQLANQSSPHGDLEKLIGIRQTALFAALALCEGAGFFGLIAYFFTRDSSLLAVPALALVLMALRFPTENGTRQWLEVQANRIVEIRGSF